MLDQAITQQLATHLERVTLPVALVASLDDSKTSVELRELLNEIEVLSPLITVVEEANVRTPSFAIRRTGTNVEVRFAGIPMGHEFTSLVQKVYKVQDDFIITTENSIYIVSGKIQKRRIQAPALRGF